MKLPRLVLAAGLLAAATTLVLAGPPPQLTIRPPSPAKTKIVATPVSAVTCASCVGCVGCKKAS